MVMISDLFRYAFLLSTSDGTKYLFMIQTHHVVQELSTVNLPIIPGLCSRHRPNHNDHEHDG